MPDNTVPAFSPAVLQYLKSVGDGLLQLNAAQLAELPPDLASDLEDVSGAATMGRLAGKPVQPAQSKVDMHKLLGYFSQGALDAEAPLSDNALDAPLASYFISTSHNTYLTGNQLYGTASTEAYRGVLRQGCRSIEIDVWDGKASSSDKEKLERKASNTVNELADKLTEELRLQLEPRVLHGHTLTKEVSFRDVCRAIGESAFETSDLPVVVSLEVHAHAEQQEKMVEIMQQTWQNMLVSPPEQDCTSLPSPASLRRKILVKVKGKALGKPEDIMPTLEKTKTEDESSSSEDESKADKANKPKPSKIVERLSALGIYTRAYHFSKLSAPEASLATHVFSLSERKVITVHENESANLFQHNCRYLMRAFPAGTRVTSTNLDPSVFWRKGIQMVALNWQKFDAGIMQNYAMFAGSGGWVLKPPGYHGTSSVSALGEKEAATSAPLGSSIERSNLDLSIEVLAAQELPPAKHPYVKCELHVETPQERKSAKIEGGGRSKDGEHKRRTKVAKDLNFKSELLEFTNIPEIVPALSFIRFKIMDDVLGPDELVAWGCIRLDRLRSGLRFLHLLDTHGRSTGAVLLIKIDKKLERVEAGK